MSSRSFRRWKICLPDRAIAPEMFSVPCRGKPLKFSIPTRKGAAMVALGERATALFTQDEKLELTIRHLGEESGDYVWPLPLWEEYDAEIKGIFGDVANDTKKRWGGAITAAVF